MKGTDFTAKLRAGQRRHPFLPAFVVLITALLLAFAAFRFARLNFTTATRGRMEEATSQLEAALQLRARMYINALLQARGLFTVRPDLSHDEFRGYVQSLDLLRDFPGIQGIGFAEVVVPTQRQAHELRLRREIAWYQVHQADGRVTGDGRQVGTLVPVTMIEPSGLINHQVVGFDLASDPPRRAALERARDTGEPQASGRVQMLRRPGMPLQEGFGIYVPVYGKQLPPDAGVEQRRRALRGFVFAPFRLSELFERVADAIPDGLQHGVSFAVYDDDDRLDGTPLFDFNGTRQLPLARDAAELTMTRPFIIAGRKWHLVLAPLATFHAPYSTFVPAAVLALGVTLSLLIFLALWVKTSQAQRDERARLIAEDAAMRHSFLARAGELLGSSLDYAHTLTQVARLMVPELADWCAVYLVKKGVLELETVACDSPEREATWRRIEQLRRQSPRDTLQGPRRVVMTGEPELVADVATKAHKCFDEGETELEGLVRNVGVKSYICVPMQVGGRIIGVVTIASAIPERIYDASDLRLIGEIAHRAALAIDNARLYDDARTSEARKASVLETSLEAIITADENMRVVEWNPAAERIFGYTAAEAYGREIVDLIVPPSMKAAHNEGYRRYVATGQARVMGRRTELPALRKDGVEIPIELSINAAQVGGRPMFTAYVRDVTDRLRDEQELLRARDMAEAASRAKSAFLANVSHEIRTPLGAILGFSELLLDPHLIAEDRRQYVETIVRNGRDLTRLIDDVLDLSKVEAGRLEIERLSFELPAFLEEILQSLGVKAREKGIALELLTDPTLPTTVTSDPTRLRQILFNIVGNAIKFTSQGSVTLTARYTEKIVGIGQPAKLIFVVSDTGRGVSAQQMNNLFQSFVQADSSTTRKFGGTGLGLVLSRRLARLLGGDVELTKSEPDKGSVFTVTIEAGAVSRVAPVAAVEMPAPACRSERPLAGVRVLIADDAKDNQLLFRRVLAGKGASVDVVDNGEQAVHQALAHRYDVVLMDIQMPVLDGYDATKELRRRGFEGPIIALTAHAMKDERERCLGIGCNDHLPKPVRHDVLVETVARYAHLPATIH